MFSDMQWLIDIIIEQIGDVGGVPTGGIIAWSGAIVDIPDGFVLCDGNNDTPNLQDKFIVGAGDTYNPGNTGGTADQTHTVTASNSGVNLAAGTDLGGSGGNASHTAPIFVVGSAAASDNRPPYYALAFIMKT